VDINEITRLISEFSSLVGKTPTISEFSDAFNMHPATIIRKFGPWNNLLLKAGLKPNKSNKRSKEQLLMWLKAHPNTKYNEIPTGIRSGLIYNFGSIGKARIAANLPISDWRSFSKRIPKKSSKNTGRPIEYSKEKIICGLQKLAKKLGRPPKIKDISKENCGFPFTAILSRFDSFNNALKAANLPPSYSYQEYKKLNNELLTIMMNIKININDVPIFYNIKVNEKQHTFVYKDRVEDVFLTRSDILENEYKILKNTIVWYLVDDSLYENEKFKIKNIMDLSNDISKELKSLLYNLRVRYDEINRKYIAPIQLFKGV
jgi:hypothetical protein